MQSEALNNGGFSNGRVRGRRCVTGGSVGSSACVMASAEDGAIASDVASSRRIRLFGWREGGDLGRRRIGGRNIADDPVCRAALITVERAPQGLYRCVGGGPSCAHGHHLFAHVQSNGAYLFQMLSSANRAGAGHSASCRHVVPSAPVHERAMSSPWPILMVSVAEKRR